MSEIPQDSLEDTIVEFIVWLTTKTEQGHVVWRRQPDSVITTLKDITVQFQTTTAESDAETWHIFSMRTVKGNELLRVIAPSASPESPLGSPLETLFSAAQRYSRMR